MLLLLGCTKGDEESDEPDDTSTTATSVVVPSSIRDVQVAADLVRKVGGAAETSGTSLVIEPVAGSALLAFSAADVTAQCVTSAILRVSALEPPAVPISAWVSIETEAAMLADGVDLGQQVIIMGSPSAELTSNRGARELSWDVTELLAWSRDHQASASHFVVVLKPVFTANVPNEAIALAALESGDGAVLSVTQPDSCR